MRLGALGGKVIDAKESKVLADVWAQFGIQQKSLAMNFAGTGVNLMTKNNQAMVMVRKGMEHHAFNGYIALCGEAFFADLVTKAIADEYPMSKTEVQTISKTVITAMILMVLIIFLIALNGVRLLILILMRRF